VKILFVPSLFARNFHICMHATFAVIRILGRRVHIGRFAEKERQSASGQSAEKRPDMANSSKAD